MYSLIALLECNLGSSIRTKVKKTITNIFKQKRRNTAPGKIVSSGKTYIINEEENAFGTFRSITCLGCNMTSYNVQDVTYKYCGNCHSFHEV